MMILTQYQSPVRPLSNEEARKQMKKQKLNMQQFHKRLKAQDRDPLFAALRRLTQKSAKTFTEPGQPTPLGSWAGWTY